MNSIFSFYDYRIELDLLCVFVLVKPGAMIACKVAAMVPERVLSLALLNVTRGGFECFPRVCCLFRCLICNVVYVRICNAVKCRKLLVVE